jgi:predicted secreted Zn-dependent protease
MISRAETIGRSLAGLLFLVLAFGAGAQGVDWKTNHFVVTGATHREIRESISRSRPFKEKFDAFTVWDVRWNFSFRATAEGCRCTGVSTVTSVTMHLPWWKVPTNAPADLKDWWRTYYARLLDHEVGHARIGLTAAAHLRRHIAAQPATASCETLKDQLNNAAQAMGEGVRRKDRTWKQAGD